MGVSTSSDKVSAVANSSSALTSDCAMGNCVRRNCTRLPVASNFAIVQSLRFRFIQILFFPFFFQFLYKHQVTCFISVSQVFPGNIN